MKNVVFILLFFLTFSFLRAQHGAGPDIIVPTIKGSADYQSTFYQEGKTYGSEEWLSTYMQYYHSNRSTDFTLTEPMYLHAGIQAAAEENKTAKFYFALRNVKVFSENSPRYIMDDLLEDYPSNKQKYQPYLIEDQLLMTGLILPNRVDDVNNIPTEVFITEATAKLLQSIEFYDRYDNFIGSLNPRFGTISFNYQQIEELKIRATLTNGQKFYYLLFRKNPLLGPSLTPEYPHGFNPGYGLGDDPGQPGDNDPDPEDPTDPTIPVIDESCNILPTYLNKPGSGEPYTATIGFPNPNPTVLKSSYEVVDYIDNGNGQFTEVWDVVHHLVDNPYTTSINRGVYGEYGKISTAVYLNPYHNKVKKPIIVTDGIDFLSNRMLSDIIKEFGGNDMISLLWDGGYDVIIVDFAGGADFIQRNSFALIEFLRSLRQDQGVKEIEAIIGPSMGGQIIRHALMYWEKNLEKDYGPHNIKNFVSADSPWSGANASPGVQNYADRVKDGNEKFYLIHSSANSPAARQLLLHHTYDRYFNNIYTPGQHIYKTEFDKELENLGFKPQKVVKILGIADGSGNGISNNVNPGGTILDIEFGTCNDFYLSECKFHNEILGIKLNDYLITKSKEVISGLGFSCDKALEDLPELFSTIPVVLLIVLQVLLLT